MKLIYAIVHDDDARKVTKELTKLGFSVTKLASTGGFLRSGNATLMVGVDDEKVDQAIGIIEDKSKSRTQIVNTTVTPSELGGVYMPSPMEVVVGGATIFVVDVEKFYKV